MMEPYHTLADRIAYWTARVERYRSEVDAGLPHPSSGQLAEARYVLRDLLDIDGDIGPTVVKGVCPDTVTLTVDVGYVHVLEAHGGGCVNHCPHPDHHGPGAA